MNISRAVISLLPIGLLLITGLSYIQPQLASSATQKPALTLSQAPEPPAEVAPEAAGTSRLESALDQEDIAAAVQQVEQKWRLEYESYFKTQFPRRSMDIAEMSRTLARLGSQTGKKPALIYMIPAPKGLELIVVLPNAKPIHKRITAAQRDILFPTVQNFRLAITDVGSNQADYLPNAQKLYEWLIASIEPDLQANQIDTLVFCLGSNLRTLPIAALHDGQKFLIEKYSLSIIPAFNLLDNRYRSVKWTRVLAMGASQFKQQTSLPAVPVELSSIVGTSWPGKFFLNQNFTLENLKAQRAMQSYGIVHLATHAEFQPGIASNSYIQFWDSRLLLDQLKDLGWQDPPVQLLVLSACRTALGDEQAELGFAGLAIQSGVKSAIASLWYVSDTGTLVLMTNLYQQLKVAPIKAEALRQTQIAMLSGKARLKNSRLAVRRGGAALPPQLAEFVNDDLSHPYYWAAFTTIGSPW